MQSEVHEQCILNLVFVILLHVADNINVSLASRTVAQSPSQDCINVGSCLPVVLLGWLSLSLANRELYTKEMGIVKLK